MNNLLKISLFGRLEVQWANQPLLSLPTRKAEALLVYLVCNGQAHPRERLAELLWQADSHTQARRNLTYDLYRLRQSLGDYIVTTHQTISFNQQADYWLDAAELEGQVSLASQTPRLSEADAAALAQALGLYQGDFLAGFYLSDAPDFEDWVAVERERLHHLTIEGLHQLVSFYEDKADYGAGIEWTHRLLRLDEFDEAAHGGIIRLLALNGQRGLALSQYDAYVRLLQTEFGVKPAPEIRALYEQIQKGDLSEITPPLLRATVPEVPFQAPVPPSHFVGREVESVELQLSLTHQPGPCIHALVGMGGVGKTTLAAQTAQQLRPDFGDGVLWANAAISSPMDILVTWAKVYEHDFSGLSDLESRAAAVRNLLADKQVLLIIDNVLASKDIQALLPNGKECATLLTTRDLDVAHALNADSLLLGELSLENARQLLIYILGEARVSAEEEGTREICALLQYLPLAVEIAAQRLKSRSRMKLSHMAARLQETKNRLGLKISDHAVRASFEVSWEALDEELRHIFPLLAVFEGRSFSPEAIAYLADSDVFEVEDLMLSLVALSLVYEEGEMQFRQHPLLADFAHEKLVEVEPVYRRMSDYYLEFSHEHQVDYEVIQAEWENILAGARAAHTQQRWQMVIDYTETLANSWYTQGRHNDARQAYHWGAEASSNLKDEAALASIYLHWAKTCIEQGDYNEAQQHLMPSLTLYQELNDKMGRADIQYQLSRVYLEHNQYSEAEDALVETLSLYTQLGNIEGVGKVLFRQARLKYYRDEFVQAQQIAEEALALQAQSNDTKSIIPTLRILAHITSKRDLPDLAQFYGQRARDLSEELHDQNELASSLYTLTCIYRLQKNLDSAQHYAQASLTINKRFGNRHGEGMLSHQLCMIYKELAQYDLALESALKSLKIFKSVQDRLGCALVLRDIGDLYHQLDQAKECDQAWQSARDLAHELNHASLLTALEERLG